MQLVTGRCYPVKGTSVDLLAPVGITEIIAFSLCVKDFKGTVNLHIRWAVMVANLYQYFVLPIALRVFCKYMPCPIFSFCNILKNNSAALETKKVF